MPWQSQTVTIHGNPIHYQRTGGDKPVLILVHGMTDYRLYWSRVIRALEDTYDLVFYDMRGHGHSGAPSAGYTPEDYAGDLLALVASLGLERPAVVGHSLGAATTMTAAALHPAAFRCIMLEDPPWAAQVATADQYAAYEEAWRSGMISRKQLDHAGRVALCSSEHPTWHPEDCERRAESDELVRIEIFSGFIPMMTYPWKRMVANVTCPALLITSDPALGGIVTPETASAFAQIAPNGRVTHIPGAGHAIHREQLDPFVAAVRSFESEWRA